MALVAKANNKSEIRVNKAPFFNFALINIFGLTNASIRSLEWIQIWHVIDISFIL